MSKDDPTDAELRREALLLTAHAFCPCVLEPCECGPMSGCARPDVNMTPESVEELRSMRVGLIDQLLALGDVIEAMK